MAEQPNDNRRDEPHQSRLVLGCLIGAMALPCIVTGLIFLIVGVDGQFGLTMVAFIPVGAIIGAAVGAGWDAVHTRNEGSSEVEATHRIESDPDMEPEYPPPHPLLMQFLLHAYQDHGCEASLHGDWIEVEKGHLQTRAGTCNESEQRGMVIIQADFLMVTPAGHHILESFAGFGADKLSALRDVCESFLDSTFHAILSALLARPSEHAEIVSWNIGGIARKVTFGALRMRGEFPDGSWPDIFAALERAMREEQMPAGLHWVRYFYSHVPGRLPVVEALFDNEPWPEMQRQMTNFPWPQSEEFYSARLFAFIEDATGTDDSFLASSV